MEALIESNGDDKGANAHWGMRPDSIAGTTSIPIPSSSSAPLRASSSTPLDISSTSSSSVKHKSSVSVSIRSEVLNKKPRRTKTKGTEFGLLANTMGTLNDTLRGWRDPAAVGAAAPAPENLKGQAAEHFLETFTLSKVAGDEWVTTRDVAKIVELFRMDESIANF